MMSSSATPSEKEIRILIADDHPIVCEGLIAVFALEDDLKVVGHAHDGEEACLLCKQLCPDILILDLRMPKKDGIEVVIELMSQKPGPGIIVLTHSAKEEDLRRALAAGAKGVETCSAGHAEAHPYYLRRLAITPSPGRIIDIWKRHRLMPVRT
jgi:DNA-binding NarL/FixJ family response regulator